MATSTAGGVLVFLAPAREVATTFDGNLASASSRRLGFATLHLTLRTSEDELVEQVGRALDDAERLDLPVVLMFDDWNFPDGSWSADADMVEWTGWPTSERTGPLLHRRWIEWAPRGNPFPPSPNVASGSFRAWLEPRQRACLRMIGQRFASWAAAGRDHLLGGVVVGWETGYYTLLHPDAYRDKEAGPLRTGYAALTHTGHHQSTVEQFARTSGMTIDAVMHDLLCDILRSYSRWWVDAAGAAGIPADRTYTHYGAFNTGVAVPPTLEGDGRLIPLEFTIAPPGRPGVTMTPGWSDPTAAGQRYRSLGQASWGAPEIEITTDIRSADGTHKWLEELTTAGADLLCIWGWTDPPTSPYAVRDTPAIDGCRRWLAAPGEDG